MKNLFGIVIIMVLGLVGCSYEAPQQSKKEPVKIEVTAKEAEAIVAALEKDMVLIPAGKFQMGPPGQEHEVTLTKPYYMGKYEVTQEQWIALGCENLSVYKGANLPAINVSWFDSQEFIKKLNAKTAGGYRLPTEAEWENACRAGTTTAYSFGDKITPSDANYNDSKVGKPMKVGSYFPNAFGLYDTHGNVWEWCEDWYAAYPKKSVVDPKGPETGTYRVLRGGGFLTDDASALSFGRIHLRTPDLRYDAMGFRLAKTK
jgi:formylglycine-generating enzyme required for sulfatase activity